MSLDFSEEKKKFINSTLSYDYFNIIITNTDGSCCYDSILKLLQLNEYISDKITTQKIQKQAVKWIEKNKKLYLNNFNMTIEEYVLFNHNLDNIKDYINYYKVYSGDNNDNIPIERWGGIPELVALSYIYKININIYTGKTYQSNKKKIIKGAMINNKPRKDFRYQLLLSTTKNNENNKTLNILYYENKYMKHFYALTEK